ncbi:MAG: hypothetical protein A2152_01365 [Candidatus Levybacteria bacterium RBG_16_35_6]|nr:MAG: hypothetical protein A2152_01365 [Candidatus Levybacteria bacterium RBG_16_35_6]
MTIRLRTLFFIALAALTIWFLYLERAILTPFILAAIFAYIFNPIANFFTHKVKLPRTISILIIYLVLVGTIVFLGIFLTERIFDESSQLRGYVVSTIKGARVQINTLPDFIRPVALDALISLEKSRIFSPSYWVTLFPQAISRIISFFLFLVAGYYFLKEGNRIFNRLLNFIPKDLRLDMEIMLRKTNRVFASYLRGQVFLVVLVSVALFIPLSILGVKFALILAIFSGFAEIVPIFGPIFAGAVAALITLISGTANFPMPTLQGAVIVIVIYFVVRMLEDYFVIPHVMGKITDLHPLIILFAVVAGGHLFGLLGLILAVPIAGAIKIILTYSFDKINENLIANKKAPGK